MAGSPGCPHWSFFILLVSLSREPTQFWACVLDLFPFRCEPDPKAAHHALPANPFAALLHWDSACSRSCGDRPRGPHLLQEALCSPGLSPLPLTSERV